MSVRSRFTRCAVALATALLCTPAFAAPTNVTVVPSTLKCPHMPCYMPVCRFDKFCMDYISPEKVANVCERLLK